MRAPSATRDNGAVLSDGVSLWGHCLGGRDFRPRFPMMYPMTVRAENVTLLDLNAQPLQTHAAAVTANRELLSEWIAMMEIHR